MHTCLKVKTHDPIISSTYTKNKARYETLIDTALTRQRRLTNQAAWDSVQPQPFALSRPGARVIPGVGPPLWARRDGALRLVPETARISCATVFRTRQGQTAPGCPLSHWGRGGWPGVTFGDISVCFGSAGPCALGSDYLMKTCVSDICLRFFVWNMSWCDRRCIIWFCLNIGELACDRSIH